MQIGKQGHLKNDELVFFLIVQKLIMISVSLKSLP